MRVLVLGGGGREHALAQRIAASPAVSAVLCAPGNGGTAAFAESAAVAIEDPERVVEAARAHRIDFVVVGPEAPLVAGVCDRLRAAGIDTFGPDASGARLEGSKAFSKRFMAKHGIPAAGFEVFDDADAAEAYVRAAARPLVVKADGLAAGKGVIVAKDAAEALAAVDAMMRKREFGAAGDAVVIEETLVGEEVSFHVVLDGEHAVALAAAQDHKRVHEGDRGPNTGGMGAYSPPPVVTQDVEARIQERVIAPTLAGFAADGIVFRGALFIGLMIVDGEPLVLEYNTRFGDPETQVLMARLGGDVMPLLLGAARGTLDRVQVTWDAPAALCVVMAAPGYPGSYPKGLVIEGVDAAKRVEGVDVIHAGTTLESGVLKTSGGRVLTVTARGPDVDAAAARAYEAAGMIRFDGVHYRRDIGWRARTPA